MYSWVDAAGCAQVADRALPADRRGPIEHPAAFVGTSGMWTAAAVGVNGAGSSAMRGFSRPIFMSARRVNSCAIASASASFRSTPSQRARPGSPASPAESGAPRATAVRGDRRVVAAPEPSVLERGHVAVVARLRADRRLDEMPESASSDARRVCRAGVPAFSIRRRRSASRLSDCPSNGCPTATRAAFVVRDWIASPLYMPRLRSSVSRPFATDAIRSYTFCNFGAANVGKPSVPTARCGCASVRRSSSV